MSILNFDPSSVSGAFALFAQRLNQDLRDWRYHLFIFGLVLVQFFQFVAATETSNISGFASAPGLRFLNTWGYLMLNVILFVGTQFCIRLIAEEKEQGTLGLLKLTGIGPFGILVGLFGSRLVQILSIFSLQLPFIVWAVTLGGVTLHQVFALFLTLSATILLIGNLGLYTSVVCENIAAASGAAYFLLLSFPISIALLRVIDSAVASGYLTFTGDHLLQAFCESGGDFLHSVSPYNKLTSIFTTGYAAPLLDLQVAVFVLVALSFFGLSILNFERYSNQTDPVPAGSKRLPLPNLSLPFRRTISRPSQRCWDNPYIWREFQFASRGFRGWAYSAILAPLLALLIFAALPRILIQRGFFEPDAFEYARSFGTFWIIAAVAALGLAPGIYMSSVLTSELKQQTLATLFLVSRQKTSILRHLMLGRFLIIGHILIWLATGAIGLLLTAPANWELKSPDSNISPYIFYPLLLLLIIPAWLTATAFFAACGVRFELIRSKFTRAFVSVCTVLSFPFAFIMIGAFAATTSELAFYEAILVAIVLEVVGILIFAAFTAMAWESTLEAIRERMSEG